ncbi:adenylate/guanylate cyclase domain-containing protein, partial [Alphaproteobacteria bacterium]|nr:adenylate/guanylate cyclase domain-containing protein [Alphaproteobacteria bacterium]
MENSQSNEIRSLKMQVAKLQLESKLRRNLASEIDKQKQIAKNAEEIAKEKSREIEGIASQLSKYLSPQLFSSIFSGEKKVLIESERKFLTVFFSDIVSFTSISDNMDSAPLTEMLNLYLTKMSEIALKYGGTIDKYIGDSVMIFFGDPQTAGKNQDAINCVKMAIEMQNTMKKLSKVFMNDFNLLNPLNIRVGINSGECTVGNLGGKTSSIDLLGFYLPWHIFQNDKWGIYLIEDAIERVALKMHYSSKKLLSKNNCRKL